MGTESTDVSSENKENSQNTESSQRLHPFVEHLQSYQVKNDAEVVPQDVLEKRILDTATKVDYSKIVDENTRVLFFGEEHSELEPKSEIAMSLSVLKDMGFTAVAMEFVGTNHQDLLDRYLKFGDDEARNYLLEFLERGDLDREYGDLTPSAYMRLVDFVRYNKLDGIAIGTPSQDRDPFTNRDDRMTNPLLKYLQENTDRKAIAVTGGMHASRTLSNNMVGILQANGVHTQSIGVFSEEHSDVLDHMKAIGSVGLSHQRVMIPNPGAALVRGGVMDIPVSFDYIVHVPRPGLS